MASCISEGIRQLLEEKLDDERAGIHSSVARLIADAINEARRKCKE